MFDCCDPFVRMELCDSGWIGSLTSAGLDRLGLSANLPILLPDRAYRPFPDWSLAVAFPHLSKPFSPVAVRFAALLFDFPVICEHRNLTFLSLTLTPSAIAVTPLLSPSLPGRQCSETFFGLWFRSIRIPDFSSCPPPQLSEPSFYPSILFSGNSIADDLSPPVFPAGENPFYFREWFHRVFPTL